MNSSKAARYLTGRRWLERGVAVQRGLFDGISLGLLDPDDLDAVGDVYHATASECRTRWHNHGGLFRWEEAALAERFSATSRLVVLAAGAGREVIALSRRGVAVDGYEPDPGLRRFGNDLLVELGLEATIADADPSLVPAFHHHYDGAIVGWGAYSLITPAPRRIAFMRELVQRLPPHSPVLVSAMTRPGRSRYLALVHTSACAVRRLRHQPAPERGDTLQPNLTHLFTLDELVGELRTAGLTVVDAGAGDYGWAVGSVPDPAIDLTQQEPRDDQQRPDERSSEPRSDRAPGDRASAQHPARPGELARGGR